MRARRRYQERWTEAPAEVEAEVTVYPLADANRALDDLRSGALEGSGVLRVAG